MKQEAGPWRISVLSPSPPTYQTYMPLYTLIIDRVHITYTDYFLAQLLVNNM